MSFDSRGIILMLWSSVILASLKALVWNAWPHQVIRMPVWSCGTRGSPRNSQPTLLTRNEGAFRHAAGCVLADLDRTSVMINKATLLLAFYSVAFTVYLKLKWQFLLFMNDEEHLQSLRERCQTERSPEDLAQGHLDSAPVILNPTATCPLSPQGVKSKTEWATVTKKCSFILAAVGFEPCLQRAWAPVQCRRLLSLVTALLKTGWSLT